MTKKQQQTLTAADKLDTIIQQIEVVKELKPLVEMIPDLKVIVKERREQEIFNKKAAKLGRFIVVVVAAIGTVIGTFIVVAKLIVTLGKS